MVKSVLCHHDLLAQLNLHFANFTTMKEVRFVTQIAKHEDITINCMLTLVYPEIVVAYNFQKQPVDAQFQINRH